jgi:hypothetical protein
MMRSVVQLNGWLSVDENVGSELGWQIQMNCSVKPSTLINQFREYPMQTLPF